MSVTVLQGDCRDVLKTLEAESVQCVVTSPPYFGLRDYGTVSWDGGDSDCDHEAARSRTGFDYVLSGKQQSNAGSDVKAYANSCPCGAVRVDRQIGLEQTPKEYVEQMVSVFREIRRVLRKDGTVWLNLGDSYAANRSYQVPPTKWAALDFKDANATKVPEGLKPKDLMMIPARVAIALCDDGWYLRSEIVWAKPNPMPESVTDRPTRSHEMIYLLSKSQTYFYDYEAVREEASAVSIARINQPNFANQTGGPKDYKTTGINPNRSMRQTLENFAENPGRNKRSVWTVPTHPYAEAHFATFPEALIEPCILAGTPANGNCSVCGSPFSCVCGSDIPLRPDDLEIVETPTGERAGDDPSRVTGRAGMNRPRGDNEGRAPMTRYEQRRYAEQLRLSPERAAMEHDAGLAFAHYIRTDRSGARPIPPKLLDYWINLGWIEHVEKPVLRPVPRVPAVVLDPFAGSGTVLRVATKHRRDAIGIELNPAYCKLIDKRTSRVQQTLPMEEAV